MNEISVVGDWPKLERMKVEELVAQGFGAKVIRRVWQ